MKKWLKKYYELTCLMSTEYTHNAIHIKKHIEETDSSKLLSKVMTGNFFWHEHNEQCSIM